MSTMDGMMTAEQMDAMAAMTGTEFDQMWLEMMIAHHEGAISQSRQSRPRAPIRTCSPSQIRSSPPSKLRSPRCSLCFRVDVLPAPRCARRVEAYS